MKYLNIGKIKAYLLLYFCFVIYSLASVCSKYAAKQQTVIGMSFFLGLEILVLFIYAILWQQALKNFPLSVAVSSKGIVVILGLLWSFVLFSETITLFNLAGAIIILTGIWMVSSDD